MHSYIIVIRPASNMLVNKKYNRVCQHIRWIFQTMKLNSMKMDRYSLTEQSVEVQIVTGALNQLCCT